MISSHNIDKEENASIGLVKKHTEHLLRLAQLTEELPSLDELVRSSSNDLVEYETENGTILGINLYSSPAIGVQRLFMSRGSELPMHQNPDQREWFIIYKGVLEVRYDSHTATLGIGDSVYFDPGSPHSAKALEDTWMLGVTVPRAKGYADGK